MKVVILLREPSTVPSIYEKVVNGNFVPLRPFALRRCEPRCHEHLARVMSLPPSQFFFWYFSFSNFLRYWQITSALKKKKKNPAAPK